jgi:hypothetical protein
VLDYITAIIPLGLINEDNYEIRDDTDENDAEENLYIKHIKTGTRIEIGTLLRFEV